MRGKSSTRKKKRPFLSPGRDNCERQKRENKKYRPYYDKEDEELWKHFNEPEWEGILDVVP